MSCRVGPAIATARDPCFSAFMLRRVVVLASLLAACGDDDPSARSGPPELAALPATRVTESRCLVGVAEGAAPPTSLSATGCVASVVPLVPTDELVPFAVASPLFSDETNKMRWLAIPPGERAGYYADGSLDAPIGTIFAKLFSHGDDPLELRFSVRGVEGFVYFTYRFEGDDARLLDGQETVAITVSGGREATYTFPSRESCRTCHGAVGVLGPVLEQLAIDVRYAGETRSQLQALTALGLLEPRIGHGMPSPHDPHAPIEARARAYLHANCAHCHRPGGFAPVGLDLDLRWSTPLEDTRTVCVPTQFEATAGEGMRIDPAYPDDSVIVRRMHAVPGDFPGPMPPVGRSVVDEFGAALVREWAASLDASLCP